jgi:DTW domain-containing protein YfiP
MYMHYKEYKRTSNSGNLACTLLGAELFLYGVDAQDQRFTEGLKDTLFVPCVLYPCSTAVDLQEWKSALNPGQLVKLIVLDGTWTQAKRIAKQLPPELPRVKLSPASISLYKSRKQAFSSRVSSIEAVALALQAMIGGSIQDYLTEAFVMKDRGVVAQNFRDYDSLPKKAVNSLSH